jgi:WD40 repeat protein
MSSIFPTIADTLELKTEKQNAHNGVISSVDFSPDGKTIVSGSWDKTLKVWAAGARFFAFLPY